ncbi:MAG: Fe-S cluster assembly protein SufD [Pirellulales bacterium]
MTTAAPVSQPVRTEFTREGFESWIQALDEPGWLTDLRRDAWDKYEQMKWPERSREEWMRSDLRGFKLNRYGIPHASSQAATGTVPQWLSEGVETDGRIETLDGARLLCESSEALRAKGVLFGDLAQLAHEHGDLVREHLFSVTDPEQDRFSMLHAAVWSSGQLLYVPRGVTVALPLHVVNGMSDGGSDAAHTLIIVEDGAEATFLHETDSVNENAAGFHCGSVEIILRPRSSFRYVNLQDWGHNVWHFAHQRACVERDAQLQWTIAAMGSRFAQVSQQVALVGKGAMSQVNGVMFTQQNQQLTYNTLQHHVAPSCRSDFLYKAALQDDSRTVWRGMIKVDEGAQKTDGYQRNDNLLLSQTSRADSIPGLEILADDVRCTHGSTSGKVDEELIFYAQSRGFTRKEAVRMIVTGFFQQIFDRITIQSVREALGQSIARQVREYQ